LGEAVDRQTAPYAVFGFGDGGTRCSRGQRPSRPRFARSLGPHAAGPSGEARLGGFSCLAPPALGEEGRDMRNHPITQLGPRSAAAEFRLPHESLDAYRVAREVVAFVAQRRARLRGLPGDLASHLERACLSALLNVAEAAGRSAIKDRKARFAIARGEACEVAAALEAACLFGALGTDELAQAHGLLVRLTQMLARLAA
jgi:four helix bundle protein